MRVENRGRNLLKPLAWAANGYWEGDWFVSIRETSGNNDIIMGSDSHYNIFSTEIPYPNQDLVFQAEFEGNGTRTRVFFACYAGNGTAIMVYKDITSNEPIMFSTSDIPDGTQYIKVFLRNYNSTYFRARRWILWTDVLSNEDYMQARSDFLDLPVSAFGYAGVYDEITSDGTKVKRWEQEILQNKSWIFNTANLFVVSNYVPIRRMYCSLVSAPIHQGEAILTDSGGVPVRNRKDDYEHTTTPNQNVFFIYNSSGNWRLYWYQDPDLTGWDWNYIPSSDEIKAYFNGWKVNGYSTTGSVTDEATGLLADGSEYTFANAGKYKNITVTKSTDDSTYESAEEGVDYVFSNLHTTAVLKNVSGSSLYFKISYDYGVTANSWVGLDGTTPSENTLSYVSSTTLRDQNSDTWWKPYVIIYQLADPEVEQVDISGSLDLYADYNYIVTDQLIPVAMEFQVDEDDVEYREDGTLRTLDGKVLVVVDKYQGINNSTAYILEHAITNLLDNPTIHMWTKSGVTSELRDEKYRGYVVHRLTFSADSTGYIQQTFPVNSAVTHTGAIFYRFVQSSDADLSLVLDDTTQQIPVSYDWNRISVSKTYSETGTGTFKISKSATSTNDIIIDVACPIVDAISFVPEYTQTSRDNGILTLQTDTNAQDDWILDFWLKFKYINSDQIIFQFENIVFGYSTSSGFYLTIGSETNSSTYSISADEWLHIVVQKSSQAFLVSVNDEAIISSEYDTSATGSTELIFAPDNTKQPDMVVSLIILK